MRVFELRNGRGEHTRFIEHVETTRQSRPMILALAALSLSMLLSSLGTSVANVALPTLTEAFDVSFQAVQWVVLAYLLGITTLIVSAGKLGDLFGRRRLLLAGLTIFLVASTVCGAAPSLWVLIIARGVQGIGAAIMMAVTLALVGETVSKERIGSAIGLLGTMSAVGTALGPSLGGALIASIGWRSIFFVNVPLATLAIVLAYQHLPRDSGSPASLRSGFDATGTLLLALTLGSYALAMTIGRGSFSIANVGLLLVTAAGVGLFIAVELRTATPLVRLSMFNDPVLSTGLAMNALVSTVMMSTLVVGPFYLSKSLGFGAAMVGAVMTVGPIVVALTGVPAGRIVDNVGAWRMTISGIVGMAAGSILLAVLPKSTGLPGYIFPLIGITFGYALFQTANNTAVMKDVEKSQRGVMSGMLNLSRNLGLITGASVMGAIFAMGSGTNDIKHALPGEVSVGMHATFAVASVFILVAFVLAVRVKGRSAALSVGPLPVCKEGASPA